MSRDTIHTVSRFLLGISLVTNVIFGGQDLLDGEAVGATLSLGMATLVAVGWVWIERQRLRRTRIDEIADLIVTQTHSDWRPAVWLGLYLGNPHPVSYAQAAQAVTWLRHHDVRTAARDDFPDAVIYALHTLAVVDPDTIRSINR